MERRLITFIVASTAFFLVYITLQRRFGPPQPEKANLANEAAEVVADESASETPVQTIAEAPTVELNESDAGDTPAPERPENPEWMTLGSMDAESGYNMLVTLNSHGAGIERIELTARTEKNRFRYRRVDIRSGYIGYFAPTTDEEVNGVRVNVIGPGTPADLAGVQVGDVIVSVAGSPIVMPEDLENALAKSKPGETVSVEILRDGTGTPQDLQVTLTDHPLDVVRLAKFGGVDQIVGNESRLSCLMTLSKVNRKEILPNERSFPGIVDPMDLNWNVSQPTSESGQTATFSIDLSDSEMKPVGGKSVRIARSYTLQPGSYNLDMSVQLDNLADEPQDLAYRLEGANGVTMEGWWYSNKISPHWRGGAAARDVVCKTTAGGHRLLSGYNLLKLAKKEANDPNETIFAGGSGDEERAMQYIGVDAQYFTVAYVPPSGTGTFTSFRRATAGIAADANLIPRHQERAINSTFFLDSVIHEVPGNGSFREDFRLFAGPKQPDVLEEYGLGDCIYYGWFGRFSKILAWLLHFLSNFVSYAIAIILLTLLVRGCMFPLSRKAAVNAQKMQELAPEMKKINEKFKDDMEGKLKAQRELQQRVGFNPLAGCLPMFLQLPIFIGLYRALSVDIELRQAAVSSKTDWASNLAGPDMLYYWGEWLWEYFSGRGTGWLGPYFNILPVLVVILFLAQQKMFMPPATDDQTRMTQKMMNIMTLMMGLFFFRVPAGLCIYFITSSLWGICERIMVKKTLPTGNHFDAAVLDGTAVPTEKSESIIDRIRSQVAQPEAPVERPNKRRRPPKKK